MSGSRYRQLFLFLVALILPSVVIAVLGWRLLASEEELRKKGAKEKREDEVKAIGGAVVAGLQGLLLAAQPGAGDLAGPFVLVGWKDSGDNLVLPWEDVSVLQFKWEGLASDLASLLLEAKRAEIGKGFGRAATLYQQAFQNAQGDAQRAFAQHGLARTMVHWGSAATTRGLDIYRRELLTLPSSVVDDSGTPFACWAARELMKSHTTQLTVLDRIEQDLTPPVVMTRETADHWRDVAQVLQHSDNGGVRTRAAAVLDRLSEWRTLLDGVEALQEKFQDLGVTADTWKTHVERNDAWLVRLAERPGARPAVVVVRARRVFERVESDRSDLGGGGRFEIVAASQDGHALNDRLLPDVRVVFSESSAVASGNPGLPQLFTGLSLLFVVSLASLSGYLAWRGTRREIRISEMRAQFVASVSHELKTPLTSIRMFAELLEMRAADESTRTEYLNTIVNESERLTRLLNNVLDFSRIEHGQKNYSMEPTHLPEVVRSAMRVMEYPLMAQGFNVQVDMDETMPPIPVDQDAIKQAVLNLLTNAMKYSGKSRAIELGVSRDNGNAMIQVRDHGIGVPPHEQARIFEKFYRANVPENHTISGTGLGLALVAHVVDAHRGHIAVESRPGEGTTFSIRLPLSAGSSAQPAGPAAARHPATNEPSPGPATPAGAEVRS